MMGWQAARRTAPGLSTGQEARLSKGTYLLTHVDWTNPVTHFDAAIEKAKDHD